MVVIPFNLKNHIAKKDINSHLLDEFYALEEQIEKIDFEIDGKEKDENNDRNDEREGGGEK